MNEGILYHINRLIPRQNPNQWAPGAQQQRLGERFKRPRASTNGLILRHKGGVTMSDEGNRQHVIVTDIHMPFWSMVIFMVKWALASIPAIIILTLIAAFAWRILRGLDTKTVVVGIEVPSSASLHSKR